MNENALALLNRLSGKNLPFLKAKRTTAGIFSPAHSFFNSASGHNWYLIALVGIFGLSRLIYWMIGVRFNASSLNWFWQYIDPQLLVTNFWRSILYLHSQPPVMNIFLGLILRFFPGWEANAFWLCYLSLGLILTVCLYLLLKNLGILPPIATVLTALFIISPACILYENWLFYTYPVCFLLLFSALFWVKFIKQPKFIYALLFFFSLGFVVLMWSLFHLIWFLAIAGALLTLRRQNYKPIALGFILPFLLVTGWYVKNAILFNQFTASTWFGMNFSKMTNSMLYYEERKELYSQGTISAISLIPPFSDLKKYESHIKPEPPTGIPVLDQRQKISQVPNFNNIAYIKVARAYNQDAIRILFVKPITYLRGLIEAIVIFYIPADNYYFLGQNREKIGTFARIFNIIFTGQINTRLNTKLRRTNPVAFYLQSLTNTGLFLIAAYISAFAFGYYLLRRRHPLSQALFFIWLTLIYAFLVGNFTEVGENNRFRFVLDPLILPFVGLLIQSRFSRRVTSANR